MAKEKENKCPYYKKCEYYSVKNNICNDFIGNHRACVFFKEKQLNSLLDDLEICDKPIKAKELKKEIIEIFRKYCLY